MLVFHPVSGLPFVLVGLALLGLTGFLARRALGALHGFGLLRFLLLPQAVLLGVLAALFERKMNLLLWPPDSLTTVRTGVLGYHVLLLGPLFEAAAALSLWPLYRRRGFRGPREAASLALTAASGVSLGLCLSWFLSPPEGVQLLWLRVFLLALSAPFFAALWGVLLGGSGRERFFTFAWAAAAVLHGLFSYLVLARGAAVLLLSLPLLLLMGVSLLRGVFRERVPEECLTSLSLLDVSGQVSVSELIRRPSRPVLLHWVFFGAVVTFGVVLVFLTLAVLLGRQLGVDFARAEEAGAEGLAPIALLLSALLFSFPFSAYLLARASGARSVLEPAWAVGLSIGLTTALFSATEPEALVIALGTAPVGFALASLGALFGIERS